VARAYTTRSLWTTRVISATDTNTLLLGSTAAAGLASGAGAGVAWWMHRRTTLSPRNLYAAAAITTGALPLAIASGRAAVLAAALAGQAGTATAAVVGRRQRRTALGAGGELREYERARLSLGRWMREPGAGRRERTYIGGEGELVRERAWPATVRALPMTADGRARLPLGEGQHVLFVGATGSGKTTSARRVLLARGLSEPTTAVLALDPKGDPGLERDLRQLAAATGRPLVVFDPFDEATDRWNPIWANDPGAVVARLVAPVEANSDSDASHYSRVLRVHLGLVCEALHRGGRWPVTLSELLRLAQRSRFARIAATATGQRRDDDLALRLADHQAALGERVTQAQLDGSLRALEVVTGQAWRRPLTPVAELGAVSLPTAMHAGAVVLWKTHVEDIKEEAETITTLALADIGAAARTLPDSAAWVLLVDEFGSVLQGRAGDRAVALMQRARSTHGQVLLSTQSISDIPSATANQHLLASLTDNFTGFAVHRQTSPESRDWLAKLFGTREIWQSTDRTLHGRADGTGSRRRAAEFTVRPDAFRQLAPGEAIVATTLGPPPEQVFVTPAPTPETETTAYGTAVYRHETTTHASELLAPNPSTTRSAPLACSSDVVEELSERRAHAGSGTGEALWE
jgi:hypothetical protein